MLVKSLKIRPPPGTFSLIFFYNQTVFQKFERSFFDQVAIDAKNVLTFQKRPLVAEQKQAIKLIYIIELMMVIFALLAAHDKLHTTS